MNIMRMESTDEILVSMAAGGNREAYQRLLERHYKSVLRVGYRVLGNAEDAEDLAQSVCEKLPSKLASFGGQSLFATWLHRIVVNAARDLIRRKSADRRTSAGWGDVELLRRAETVEAQALLDWLFIAMESLPLNLRETVALVSGEDMTHAEAAQVLGLSEGTISWRMSEVKKILSLSAKKEEMIK